MLHEPSIMPDAARERKSLPAIGRAQTLVHRARVGGAAADRPPEQRRAVLRAVQAGAAGRREVAGVRSAAPAEDPQGVADGPVQALRPRRRRGRRPAGRGRCPPARAPRRTSRLPSPAMRDWSMSTALTGARLLADDRRAARASVRSNASGPRRSSSGSSSTAPRRRGSRRYMRAAVGERHAEAVPRRDRAGCSRRAAGRRRPRRRRARARSCRGAGRGPRRDRRRRPGSACRAGARAVNDWPVERGAHRAAA